MTDRRYLFHPVSRRNFLQTMALIGFGGAANLMGLPVFGGSGMTGPATKEARAFFELVPSSLTGITWKHFNGRSPQYYLPETTGAGCAFFDYDNDGWLDIYLVNSGKCDFFDPDPPLRNALYKNNRDGTFTDVTAKAGVSGGGYGMGAAVGDYDNDGFPDLYVTQYGRSILYHNNGDGTFTNVTEKAGVAAPGWASSAVWFDYDNDGLLDLFVCRFVDFNKEKNKFCGNTATQERYYCVPRVYAPMPSWLFHNNGDGSFTDVSQTSGIANYPGKAWGVVACDINNDGRLDLFVANDTVANFLLRNEGNGKFVDIATEAGVAYSSEGNARSGMGVDAADYDGDGWTDLFVANVDREMYSLYHNNRDNTFDDQSVVTGIGKITRLMSGWGLKFFDFNNDGNMDLFLANGHPDDKVESHDNDVQYSEPMLLFRNNENKSPQIFENVSSQAGPIFHQRFAARGLAIGDFDNNGAIDVLVSVNNEAPILLRNTAATGNHWVGVHLVGKRCNRDAIGAVVTWQAEDLNRHIFKVGGGSYLSSHDPRLVLGLGFRTKIDWVEVKWPAPSGLTERFMGLAIDEYQVIEEGKGRKLP